MYRIRAVEGFGTVEVSDALTRKEQPEDENRYEEEVVEVSNEDALSKEAVDE